MSASTSEGNTSSDISRLRVQSPRLEWSKELNKSDDLHCVLDQQKWLKLQCRMLGCIQQLMASYKEGLGSCIRIGHLISRATSTNIA